MKRLALAAVLCLGCSTPRAQLRTDLGKRASDWLRCPERDLQYDELDRLISTTKVRVSGCKKAVTYKLVESRWQRAEDNEPLR